jgi:hypothetical protein
MQSGYWLITCQVNLSQNGSPSNSAVARMCFYDNDTTPSQSPIVETQFAGFKNYGYNMDVESSNITISQIVNIARRSTEQKLNLVTGSVDNSYTLFFYTINFQALFIGTTPTPS